MAQTLDVPATPAATVKNPHIVRRLVVRPEAGSFVAAVIIFVYFFATAEPFRHTSSFGTVLYNSATYGMMAVTVGLLMIGGEFDLSAGVAVTSASLTSALTAYQLTLNVWVGVVLALVVALLIGFANGYLTVKTGIPSFLITLGTFLMLQGANIAVTKLITGQVASQDISTLQGFHSAHDVFASQFTVLGVPVSITVVYWIVLVAIGSWILLRTRVGNWIFAVGGNKDSARAVGVAVGRTKIGLFMAVGFTAWFVGMHELFNFTTVQSGNGVGNEFYYIIAAVIGGILLTGGYGTVIGSAIGSFILGMTTLGIVYEGWDPDWFQTFLGVLLLAAAVLNAWVRNLAARR